MIDVAGGEQGDQRPGIQEDARRIHSPKPSSRLFCVDKFRGPFLNRPTLRPASVRALRRRPKVYNFPWQMALVMKLTAWLPDWVIERALAGKSGGRSNL